MAKADVITLAVKAEIVPPTQDPAPGMNFKRLVTTYSDPPGWLRWSQKRQLEQKPRLTDQQICQK